MNYTKDHYRVAKISGLAYLVVILSEWLITGHLGIPTVCIALIGFIPTAVICHLNQLSNIRNQFFNTLNYRDEIYLKQLKELERQEQQKDQQPNETQWETSFVPGHALIPSFLCKNVVKSPDTESKPSTDSTAPAKPSTESENQTL